MRKNEKILSPGLIMILLFFIICVPMLPLLISWNWGWWEAWAYAVVNIFGFVISRYLAGRENPDLIKERGKFLKHANTEAWDKSFSLLLGVVGSLIPLTAGLDTRFGGTIHFVLGIRFLALALMIAGYALGSYALLANRYFSGVVRIQSERDHQAVTSGPYRWVRHPGYAGALLSYLASPFLLESLWTLVPALFALGILVARTAREDCTLQEKLEGYREYAGKVKFRLFPGVW